ncbi:MAG: ABC transporter ATP-binding protein [bacterium]|nr:ABC transporter ATP-binding protein [bacterium]
MTAAGAPTRDQDRHTVSARGVTKAFPGVVANDGVDFDADRGEVHALLGENGSGKTTLCKILTGLYRPDAGQVLVGGDTVAFRSPADAYEAGIFMVHQHFSLVSSMTVAENVVLGWHRDKGRVFNRRQVEEEVARAAERFDMHIDPRAIISRLSVGERQRVEILKALYRGARTLILDEPTSVLTPQEAEQLFVSLRRMAAEGESVVFISHKLDEVTALCDRVTVLRHGRVSGSADLRTSRVDARGLARMMVGRDIAFSRRSRVDALGDSEPALELRDVSAVEAHGTLALHEVTLSVRPGEILGVAGVSGNGQVALAEVIAGLRKRTAGDVTLQGKPLPSGNPRAAADRGLAYVPEDRLGTGLAPGLTVADNCVLKAYRQRELGRGPFLSRIRILARTRRLLKAFDVRGTAESLVRQLSGGNAQKVLLAREISSEPQVLVVATPTRGLDVSAMESIRSILLEAAAGGAAILMISEDLAEILDLADRIAVISRGRIQGVLEADGADPTQVGVLMMGGSLEDTGVAAP